MQRAAAGLAARAAPSCSGGSTARGCVLLVGAGDNGGDALFAGAALARRGARVRAVLLAERAHAGGLAALPAAGGRVVGRPTGRALADLIVDAWSTGSSASAAVRASGRAAGRGARPAGRRAGGRGRRPERGRRRHRGGRRTGTCAPTVTVTFGSRQAGAAGRPGGRGVRAGRAWSTSGSTCREPAVRGRCEPADVAAPAAGARARTTHKYTRGRGRCRGRLRSYPGAALLCVGAAPRPGWPAWSGTSGRRPSPSEVRAGPPRGGGGPAGCRPGWSARAGRRPGAPRRWRPRWPTGRAGGGRRRRPRAPAGGRACGQPGRGDRAVLTPHAGELARMLGAPPRGGRGGALAARPGGGRALAGDRAAQGRRTLVVAPDGQDPGQPHRHPVAGHRRRRRRARRPGRRPARRRAGAVRRGLGGRLAARRRGAARRPAGRPAPRPGPWPRPCPESVRRLCAGVGESPHE